MSAFALPLASLIKCGQFYGDSCIYSALNSGGDGKFETSCVSVLLGRMGITTVAYWSYRIAQFRERDKSSLD